MTIQQDVLKIRDELNSVNFERQDAINAMLLAVLSKNHCFLLGPPGTAKSSLAYDVASRFEGANFFSALLSRTRPAEAILGPLDLPKLRDTGQFQRRTLGYLPTADIAFLDEIGNQSPTLGHDLHSILNERILHEVNDEGRCVSDVPLYTCWSAGNQLPTEESDDAAALWDRLILRCKVDYVTSGGSFEKLFSMGDTQDHTTVSWEAIKNVIDNEIPEIPISPKVIDSLMLVREKLQKVADPQSPDGIIISDRRWKACARVLQAQAWLMGKDMVTEIDMLALKNVLWVEPYQIDTVERLLISVADRISDQIRTLRDNVQDLAKGIKERKDHSKEQRSDHATHTLRKAKAIKQELLRIKTEHPDHDEVQVTIKQFKNMWTDMFKTLLEQEPADFDSWMGKN